MNVGEKKRDGETYLIIGAAMEVHKHLGNGFLEAVYHDALEREFSERGIPHLREHPIPIFYKGASIGAPYRADFVCYGCILVELKAVRTSTAVEDAQVIHYLNATRLNRALLFNFGAFRLEYKRLVHDLRESASSAVPTPREPAVAKPGWAEYR